jgi:4-amino-4-deoxy-L-arabinose transferase-like glycosyltransferase
VACRRPALAWFGFTLAASAIFGRFALHNLANYRPVSNDEGELIEVSYKLSTRGVLGSDMYAGFFGADQHHLWTLPAQHMLDAASFVLFGPGVLQARMVSVLAGVSVVWLVGWLALRWYGLGTAVVCEFLLIAWRSNLTAASDGLPLLGVARTARYDVLAVAFAWLAIAFLDASQRRPDLLRGLLLGATGGLAALSQFFGTFVLALIAISSMWIRGRTWRTPIVIWIVTGGAIVLVPWLVYAARYASDLAGQLTVFGDRGDFLRANFYVENVLTEPSRFAPLLQLDSLSPWLLIVGFWPALAYVGWRAYHSGAIGNRLLLASLITFSGLLMLLDQTKVPLYSILLLPSLCLMLAAAWTGGLRWTMQRRAWPPFAAMLASVALLVVIGVDGGRAYQLDFDESTQVSPYLAVGEEIDAALVPGAGLLGPERYWWALHAHPYLSIRSIWFQWTALATSTRQTPQLADWFARSGADFLIVNVDIRDDIHAFPQPLQAQFWSYLDQCATLIADLPNVNYFPTQVYAILRPAEGACAGFGFTGDAVKQRE